VIPALRADEDLWRRMLKRCNAQDVLVVMGVRRPQGRRGLVGVLLRRDKGSNTLDPERLRERLIEPVRIIPADPGFLLPRGGADLELTGRRVLLVGCGAVGGHVAFDLVKAGVGEIHLLDHDRFEYANAFRHVCGRAHVREFKVHGVAAEILRLWPFVKVVPHVENLLSRLRTRPESLREYDLVVSAIGNPTVDLRLNEVIHGDPAMPPAIFAWLEPLGLGGHVLATHVRAGPRGCYECLYQRESRREPLACRAAFAAPGGRYTRDTMGCGSQHMAFADLDAQRTAAHVARSAVDLLRGAADGGGLVSWRGPADAFRAAGFATTLRYDVAPLEETLPGASVARSDCPVCRTP
jgi:molybdopterin/thiamine biosynthesis adenylyltransferase